MSTGDRQPPSGTPGAAPAGGGGYPQLDRFAATRPFRLDPFQLRACRALEDGTGVLVCAPTGAGKTVVGEFAVARALTGGGKCFYTTPIKALSNQKYADLAAEHGREAVGLLTGDTSVNPGAPVVVMTTEVLRNMLYAGSGELAGLSAVVLDEIHYLADRFRGGVWEEVILHLAQEVQLVGLSATVSNAEEFGDWLREVRGEIRVIVDEVRPVPLWQHMMVGRSLYDLYAPGTDGARAAGTGSSRAPGHGRSTVPGGTGTGGARIDPHLHRAIRDADAAVAMGHVRHGRGRPALAPRWRPTSRADVVKRLDGAGLLPAIMFVFSRVGCDAAAAQCVRAGLRLVDDRERAAIGEIIDRHTADLPESDLDVLDYHRWRQNLLRGIAAHHAGLLPAFKEAVEELFVAGLVKVVFATETLALGINMPARTVVLERLVKFDGETHADLTPGEYTQLTGRAGRRGIDVEGHAVVVWSPGMDPRAVAGLASTRTFPLRSSFRPSYNMAINLVSQLGRDAAAALLAQSFAQFQTDRAVVGLARRVARNEQAIAELDGSVACEFGDVGEYLDLRFQLAAADRAAAKAGAARRRQAVAESLALLRRGDVIHITGGRRAGLAVVLDPGRVGDGALRPLVATEARWAGRLSVADFRAPVRAVGRLKLHKVTEHWMPKVRRDLASALASSGIAAGPGAHKGGAEAAETELSALRSAVQSHPVHRCHDPDEHVRQDLRRRQLRSEANSLTARIDSARGSLSLQLERILTLLTDRGYLESDRATEAGRILQRIWSESDLLAAECLRRGLWATLSAPELAGVVSALIFEARRDVLVRPPAGQLGSAVRSVQQLWAELAADERRHGMTETRPPDSGFAAAAASWAAGATLAEALLAADAGGTELSAGDFVRWCRQAIDLLDQIQAAAPRELAPHAREAMVAMRRGVVAIGAV